MARTQQIADRQGTPVNPATNEALVGPVSQVGAGQRLTMAGAAQTATIPPGTTLVRLAAEGGELRWALSGQTPSATSPGLLPEDAVEFIEVDGDSTLKVFGAAGSFANLLYLAR